MMGLPLVKYLLTHICREKAETKEEASQSRLVVGRFNKEKERQRRFVLGPWSRCLHLPTRILKMYIEALTGFSYLHHLDGLNNTSLSQGYIFGMAPHLGMVSRVYIPRTGVVVRSLQLLGPACGSTRSHIPLVISSIGTQKWFWVLNDVKLIIVFSYKEI